MKRSIHIKRKLFLLILILGVTSPLSAVEKTGRGTENIEKSESGKGTKVLTEKERKKKEKGLEKLEQDIRFAATTERIQAMGRVSSLDAEDQTRFVPFMEKAFRTSPDPLVRKTAISMLGKIKSEGSEKVFVDALTDSDDEVSRNAIQSLVQIKAENRSPEIFDVVKDLDFSENNLLIQSAINTLGRFEYKESVSFFLNKLNDPAVTVDQKRYIVLYFGSAKAQNAVSDLTKILKNSAEDTSMREYAANSLGKIGDHSAVAPLKEILGEIHALTNSQERARVSRLKLQIIAALVKLGDSSVVDELLTAARDDNAGLRYRAIQYLGEIKYGDARELLEYKSKHDPDSRVRRAASNAIDRIDGKNSDGDESINEDDDAI